MKTAILGTTGYTGMLLTRILSSHPEVGQIVPVSSSKAGTSLFSADPGLGRSEKSLSSLEVKTTLTGGQMVSIEQALTLKPDVVFSALPHLASAPLCSQFLPGSVVIDLSADFRLNDPDLFHRTYGEAPKKPELFHNAVYGLSEVYRESIQSCDLIANPGCYPTASLLPLVPLASEGFLTGTIFVNAMSGISGAGKKAKENLLFCERSENAGAYSPGKSHRHTPEINQELLKQDPKLNLYFTPHLVPLRRGMSVTTAVSVKKGIEDADIARRLENFYQNACFVEIRKDRIPETKDVLGSNRCDIGWHMEGETLFLFSVIDNLMKGAAGQAVQNMNIRFGFDESAGLRLYGEV